MNKPPTERRFDIVFHGEAMNGFDVSEVKENLRQLFKLGDDALERMFTGEAISIKKDLDRKTAGQYQQALTRAGAKIQLVLNQASAKPADRAVADAPTTASATPQPAEKPAAPAAQSGAQTSSTEHFDLLPAGSQLGPESTNHPAPVVVDVSHISVLDNANAAGRAIFAVEDPFVAGEAPAEGPRYPDADHIELDTALSVAELGRLLEQAEEAPSMEVNTDHLEVDEVGVTLGDERQESVAAPTVSADIALADPGGDLLQSHEKRVVESVEVDTSALSLNDN